MPQYDADNKVDGIPLVTEEARDHLNPKQEIAYREHRRELAEWLLNLGKNPQKAEGYSRSVVKTKMNRLDLFYRFVWEREGRYVQDMTTDYADQWMRWLARQDYTESTKCNYQKAVKTLFKWKRDARGSDVEWTPEIEYSDPSTNYQPREYLTKRDRKKLRQAALEYGSVPHYNSVSPEERDRWRSYLAQRLQKPKEEVTKQDFMDANSFKYTSMIYAALDAGLRPCEVGRANVAWVDTANGVLRIPREEPIDQYGPAVQMPDMEIFMDHGGDPIPSREALEQAYVEEYDEIGTVAFETETAKNFYEYRSDLLSYQ